MHANGKASNPLSHQQLITSILLHLCLGYANSEASSFILPSSHATESQVKFKEYPPFHTSTPELLLLFPSLAV